MKPTQNLNIRNIVPLTSPRELKAEPPVSGAANRTVVESREAVQRILSGEDKRMIVVVGPCSIHDPAAGLEYAARLHRLAGRVADRMLLIMRVYFEKPRTTIGWKGLINDPHLDGSCDVGAGLALARRLVVIVGPCSIHDPDAALEYAGRLAKTAQALEGELLVVMRTYFEKPRTTIGWKGLIND
ncbi:MAG: hypothetical protein ACREJB_17850, partial [Planctomycetaceae bacterium]